MNGDNDSFTQEFSFNTPYGDKGTIRGNAKMRIYMNSQENNIKSMSLPTTSGDGFNNTHHLIRFFNSKSKEVIRLGFKNRSELLIFYKVYYSNIEKETFNSIIREYKNLNTLEKIRY